MSPIEWLLSLTDHQLNVLGTVFSVLASGATVLGIVAANYARLARRDAKVARAQTSTQDWESGRLVETSVAESARHAAIAGEATRAEISHLAVWLKGTGRRRLPTTEVPRLEESSYE